MSSEERHAIITGGTRGIGRGIATSFAQSGDYSGLLLSYNTNHEAAQAFAEELQSESMHVEIVGGDLTCEETRDHIFRCLDEKFSNSDLCALVHNAGQYVGITSDNADELGSGSGKHFGDGSLFKDGETESDKPDLRYMHYYQKLYGDAFIDLCERSIARMTQASERSKKVGKKYRGSIIGISSPGCNHIYKMSPGYDMPGSGKCIMEYAVRLYARQVGAYGINCNVIIPGFTESDAWTKVLEARGSDVPRDEFLQSFVSRVPMREICKATDIGELAVFLSGFGAGRFLTGMLLRCDGGTHLG